MGHAPTSQAKPRDTANLRSTHWADSQLVAYTLEDCRGPWRVRRGLVAGANCYVRKTRFLVVYHM